MLFSGTLRSNLDPFDRFDDAKLWDALKRSHLLDSMKSQDMTEEGEPEAAVAGEYGLDTIVEDGGSNLSVGQRSLISLARALVKDAKVLILDEATGTMNLRRVVVTRADPSAFQPPSTTKRTRRFKIPLLPSLETVPFYVLLVSSNLAYGENISNDRFTFAPADRLQTIIGYDRICVMDSGRITEFDTPTRLFNIEDGVFRGMCDRSGIALEDIRMAAKLGEA